MKKSLLFLLVFLFSLPYQSQAAKYERVYNVENEIPSGLFQLETVNNAIVKALTFKRWRINSQDEEAGVILAQIAVRDKHFASVEITYTTTNFSIKRLETKGLGYRPSTGNIHRNYNKWVKLLEQQIIAELSSPGLE